MDGQNNGTFWPSYVDIMTTLFAIMLVLFVVSFARFKITEGELRAKEAQLKEIVDEYENILNLYSTVGKIDRTEYFGYNQEYLKHLFQINVEYQAREFEINRLQLDLTDSKSADEKRKSIIKAGELIRNTIDTLNLSMSNEKNNNIKILVIIEGQSSKVPFNDNTWMNNYTLSYLRAQYLNKFWMENGIYLDSLPRCELLISGSGEGGVPRNNPDMYINKEDFSNESDYWRRWLDIEVKNQRFMINIVPVLGNIDITREKIEKLKKQ